MYNGKNVGVNVKNIVVSTARLLLDVLTMQRSGEKERIRLRNSYSTLKLFSFSIYLSLSLDSALKKCVSLSYHVVQF